MSRMYFHCANDRGALIDPVGIELGGLAEACDHAGKVVQALIGTPTMEDWRGWTLHVTDDHGDDLFELPFASALSKPH